MASWQRLSPPILVSHQFSRLSHSTNFKSVTRMSRLQNFSLGRPASFKPVRLSNNHFFTQRYQSSRTSPIISTSTTQTAVTKPPRPMAEYIAAPFRAYNRLFGRHPYLSQIAITMTVYAAGDIAAQRIAHPNEYSLPQTLRGVFIGATAAVPAYRWFLWLGTKFNYTTLALRLPATLSRALSPNTAAAIERIGSKTLNVTASLTPKVLIGQIFYAPMIITYFFSMQNLLAGNPLSSTVARLKDTLPTTWWNSWKIWPMVSAINFGLLPIQYRGLFAGSVGVLWQCYLSWVNTRVSRGLHAEETSKVGISEQRQAVGA